MSAKRQHGQFFTAYNPFDHPAFMEWAEQAHLPRQEILEPFAGANCIIRHLEEMEGCATGFAHTT